ncbi:hypothetical protein HYW21_02640 [Candidatus Woesearchaeota archaeon]|nr:hypothetical protein [Candidatus Woesearchaeota archaeon]
MVLVIGSVLIIAGCTSKNYDSFAACLAEKNVTMYGAFWCSHCQDQKELFGDSWNKVPYIECSLPDGNGQTPYCEEAGITSYPTWELPDGRVSGTLPLKQLGLLSGCPLE